MSKTTVENLEAVRSEMRRVGVDAVIIPGTDPHQSEYINDHWKLLSVQQFHVRQLLPCHTPHYFFYMLYLFLW